ncbi:GNAT family N-acetyltransferase [Nocardia farcinica]|uniref:GNAT family N-acetyltransferase n=1 Tax=Nocardia farcinica TaxID=37329 RepID=UPI002455469B|nr:GNAT family N-acetyltransferase [Nocardia farcinica]
MADQQQNSGEQKRVTRNADKSRYEIFLGDQLAGFVEYEESGDRIDFVHTEIDDAFSGKGLGSALAKGALDDAVAGGRAIVATCRFIAGYIDRHPEYARHLAGSDR